MTTVLVTKDFIVSDRRTCWTAHDHIQQTEEKKMYIMPDGRGCVVCVGERNKELTPTFMSILFDLCVESVENDSLSPKVHEHLKYIYGEHTYPKVYISCKGGNYSVLPTICKTYKNLCVTIGSGGGFARAYHNYGVAPEEIIGRVSNLDPQTSPQFDIFYHKDIK